MAIQLSEPERILFENHYGRVFKAVILFCNDIHLAEDATQEAFYRAFKNIKKLRNRKSFAAWVYSIAANVIRTDYRNEKKLVYVNFDQLENCLACEDTDAVELREDVRKLLLELDRDHRDVLLLRYFFDLSIEEISLTLSIKDGTVKSRLYRARQQLRIRWMKQQSAERD